MYGGQPEYPHGRERGHYDSGIVYTEDPFAITVAEEHAKKSLIYGLIGFFLPLVGVVFGPLAIKESKLGKEAGVQATLGKILGIVSLIGAIIFILGCVGAVALPAFLHARNEALMNQ